MSMPAPAYNRSKLDNLWSILSLPEAFPGRAILEAADIDRDLALNTAEADAVDWNAFTDAVREFQSAQGIKNPDAKLGPKTYGRLVANHGFPVPDMGRLGNASPGTRLLRVAQSQMGVVEYPGENHNPIIMNYSQEIGLGWVENDETPWCSIFMNWCALKAGVPGTGDALARSWEDVGAETASPKPGDLAVFWREAPDSPYGHIALFDGYAATGSINVLGGNQGDRVGVTPYAEERLLSFRRL